MGHLSQIYDNLDATNNDDRKEKCAELMYRTCVKASFAGILSAYLLLHNPERNFFCQLLLLVVVVGCEDYAMLATYMHRRGGRETTTTTKTIRLTD